MNGKNVFINFIWRFLERCGAQGIALVVSLILARVLGPNVYGVVALVTVFTNILQVFIDSGLGIALVQKKEADEVDFSSVFWFNITMCTLLYMSLFVSAGFIASFYGLPELKVIVRVMGLTIPISGIKNIQQSYVTRHMLFKKFFYATLIGTLISAAIGVYMAYAGFGVWALVAQNLSNQIVDTVILWIIVGWRPKFVISGERLKGLLSYGGMLLAANLIDNIFVQLRQLIIGKKYTSDDLAFYNSGDRYPRVLVSNINSAIDSVLLPAMSSVQDDYGRIKEMTSRSIKVSTYCLMPMMVGLAICAPSIVKVLLTESWMECVPYIRIFCFTYLLYPMHTANLNAIKATGRTELYFNVELAKKSAGLLILLISFWFGPLVIAIGVLIEAFVALLLNVCTSKRVIKYGLIEQLKDILPNITLSIGMGIAICAVFLLIGEKTVICLIIQVLVGGLFYLLASVLFNNESFLYITGMLKK